MTAMTTELTMIQCLRLVCWMALNQDGFTAAEIARLRFLGWRRRHQHIGGQDDGRQEV